jgi:hypothetical protein
MAVDGIQGTNSPNIIIQELSASPYGFAAVNTNWVWGTVKVVYPGCMKYEVDDVVFYDKTQARRFKYGSINYFAIDEQYIYYIETPVV